ncbi:hypothetical protein G6F31_021649 [Rhizopus arrhizus]|nr:hypothetical protein G6F31_021649 [Rhizopus arrhizus]
MPWAGVQFDAKGQNTKGSGLILELKGSSYQTVWPEKYRTDKTLPTLPFSWNSLGRPVQWPDLCRGGGGAGADLGHYRRH